jgi:hypothetical protein
LDRLYKAVAYDKLQAEGKIEPAYADKLANERLSVVKDFSA